jgi:DNA-directed RNA polymerase alpha subunit
MSQSKKELPLKLHPRSADDYSPALQLSDRPELLDGISLRDVPLTTLAFNALWSEKFRTLGDVARMTPAELRRIPNIGRKSAAAILHAIENAEKGNP